MNAGAGGFGVEGGKLEFAVRIVAEDEDDPAIAEMALSVVDDDGFGLMGRGHSHLMPGMRVPVEKAWVDGAGWSSTKVQKLKILLENFAFYVFLADKIFIFFELSAIFCLRKRV